MKPVYIAADHLLSSLGSTVSEHMEALWQAQGGIAPWQYPQLGKLWVSRVDDEQLDSLTSVNYPATAFTRLERMMLFSIEQALADLPVSLSSRDTLLIICTTKGNIHLLEKTYRDTFPPKRLYPAEMGRIIARQLKCAHVPLIVSNACISGVLGILIGARLIRENVYKHVVVCGGDLASEFVVSGFQALKATSPGPCRPYDAKRDGISLGEASATVVLTADKSIISSAAIQVLDGASTNDANHISGPSRTGEGLVQAIDRCLQGSNRQAKAVDFISAHGTATLYNDEMESVAFYRTGLLKVPVNSYKGYLGHTLGAAGVVESVLAINCLKHGVLHPSLGFEKPGITHPMNIITRPEKRELQLCLKTASGFGGCNAAVLFEKVA